MTPIIRQRGFTLYAILGALLVIAGLGIALKVQSSRLASEQTAHAETKGKFASFVAETKRMGDEAKAKAEAEIIRQKEVSNATAKSYEKRLAAVNDAYRLLRDGRAGSSRGDVPAVPTAPIVVDDPASRDRLLEVLYHADRNTSQLIELQDWLRAQAQK